MLKLLAFALGLTASAEAVSASLPELRKQRQEAEQRGEFAKAVQFQAAYQKAWEAEKKVEEQTQLEALSRSTGVALVEEKNRALRHENERQASRLRTANRVQYFLQLLAGLGVGILILLLLSLRQRKFLDRSEKKLRVFLDSIDEALLMVDHRLRIDPDKSPVLARDVTSLPDLLLQLQVSSADREKFLADIRSAQQGGHVEWTTQDQRIVDVRWLPISDRTLVIMRDLTRQKALENILREQKKQLEQFPSELQELASVSLSQSLILIQRTAELLAAMRRNYDATQLRELHTRKGEARTLGLPRLSGAIHDLETALRDAVPHQENLAPVQLILDEYLALVSNLHQQQDPSARNLLQAVGEKLPAWLLHMRSVQWPWLELHLLDEIVDWSPQDLQIVEDFLLHGVNNSLDHGFILPRGRGLAVERPMISIRALRQDQNLRIEIEDNGVGLNWEKLKELARERSFVPASGGSVADLVFFDGVSTAESVSNTSGRGVGLAAVRESFEKRRGHVHITSRSDKRGTLIWGVIPLA